MLNNVSMMGRLTTDPEIRQTPSGTRVVNFTLAIQRDVADSTGNRPTDFIPCVAWAGTAEFVNRNFHKGDLVLATGRMQSRSYTDRNNQKRNVVEMLVANVYFSGERRESGSPQGFGISAIGGHGNEYEQQGFVPVDDNDPLPF